jgi:hypothetical protein
MPPKKGDAAKSSSSVPPLEPHDPSAEPEVSAGAREVEEREFAIGRLKTQLGEFQDASAVLEIQTETLRDAVAAEEEDAGDVRAYLRRELSFAEALVKTLAVSVAERESEVKAQSVTIDAQLEDARAADAERDEAVLQRLKKHDLEAEKQRNREQNRNDLLAAIDAVSETLAFESRERRSQTSRLEGEALSEKAALARAHELVIREKSLALIRKTDEQLVVTTKRAIWENERETEALAVESARCERLMEKHEDARLSRNAARAARDATKELNAFANERTVTLLRKIEMVKKRIADVERDRRAFNENVSQVQQDAFVADFEARGLEATVVAARLDLTRVARERDDARARLREARERRNAETSSASTKEKEKKEEKEARLDAAATLVSSMEAATAATGLTSSELESDEDFASRLRMQTLDAFADALEARNIPGVPGDASVRPGDVPGDDVPGTSPADDVAPSREEPNPSRRAESDPVPDAVRALVGMPALPKAKDLPPIPSFEARMMSWGVK